MPPKAKETAARSNKRPSYEGRSENMRSHLTNFSEGLSEIKTTLAVHGEKMTEMHGAVMRLEGD